MRRFLLFALAATLFVACTQDVIDEQRNVITDDNRTLTVSLDGDANDTRIQLNEEKKSVWTEGDLLSVFYRSTTNEQWQFAGKTGDRSGNILPVDSSIIPTPTTNDIVVVYPYNAGYFYNSDTKNVQASLPAEQNYLKDSYGLDGNIMVSQSEYNQVSLKSVCGWLKLQLTGTGETVRSITLRGNAGEQVAGELYINTADATSTLASELAESGDDGEVGGTLVRPGTILTEVTLNCGEGVALDAEATSFYIALPPMTFEKGITVDVICEGYNPYTISTDKKVVISRNTIQPMATVEHEGSLAPIPNNQIWYTCATKVAFPNTVGEYFGAELISHEWDSTTGKGVMIFDGDVTAIGGRIFYGDDITEIHIPKTVTKIGSQAFGYCSELQRVYIYDLEQWCNIDIAAPSGSPAYYGDVYLNGELLTEITIPDSITKIKNNTFCGWKSLNNVYMHDNVTEIGTCGFAFCSFSNITLPESITSIGEQAFYNCYKLTSFHTPDSVTNIGDAAFWQCYNIKEFTGKYATDNGRCIIIDGRLIDFADACGQTQYCIPDGVTSIGDAAFRSSTLKHITIPEGVEEIGEWGFAYCESLESITIPQSLKRVEDSSFYICKNGTKVYISDLTAWCNIEFCDSYTPLSNSGKLYLNNELVTHLYIPDDVTKIGDYAFTKCASITNVTISDNVQVIGDSAFWGCSNLTDVHIGNSVTTIEGSAFAFCDKLTTINIPNSVTIIKDWAFGSCDSLTSITIPESVVEIEEAAFYYCTSLKTVYCKPTTPPTGGSNMFYANASDRKIYVPASDDDSIINEYKAKEYWSDYADYIYEMDEPEPLLEVVNNVIDLSFSYSSVAIQVKSNVEYECVIPEDAQSWIRHSKTIAQDEYDNVYIYVSSNMDMSARSATITFKEVEGDRTATATINQTYFEGFDDSALDTSKYLVYKRNNQYITSGGIFDTDIYSTSSYITTGASDVVIAEYKFQLPQEPGQYGEYSLSDDCVCVDNYGIRFYYEGRDGFYSRSSHSWETLGVKPTDVITIRFDNVNDIITVNGVAMNLTVDYTLGSYVFSYYYRDSDDGVYEVYGGFMDNAHLYYVKGWDANGRLVYLGYADKATNADGVEEACWRSYGYSGSLSDKKTFSFRNPDGYEPFGMGNM